MFSPSAIRSALFIARGIAAVTIAIVLSAGLLPAQIMDELKPVTEPGQVIRVGIAYPVPLMAGFPPSLPQRYLGLVPVTADKPCVAITDKDALLCEVKKFRFGNPGDAEIETVELKAMTLSAARKEGEEKNCDFVVLTHTWDVTGRSVSVAPGFTTGARTQRGANTNEPQRLGLQLTIVRVKSGEKVTDDLIIPRPDFRVLAGYIAQRLRGRQSPMSSSPN